MLGICIHSGIFTYAIDRYTFCPLSFTFGNHRHGIDRFNAQTWVHLLIVKYAFAPIENSKKEVME